MSDSLKKAAEQAMRIKPAEKDVKPDRHKDATVTAVNSDGSYQVAFDDAPDTPIKCSAGCTAGVGDRVLVCIMANGRCVAVARLEGTAAEFAKEAHFLKRILLENGVGIYFKDADGVDRLALNMNSNNNTNIGYGGYNASQGTTHVYGNEVRVLSKSAIKMTSPDAGISGRAYGVNKVLWSGTKYMTSDHTITLSEAISAQPHGAVFVLSYYSTSSSTAGNYNWQYFFVPKSHIANHSGTGINFSSMANPTHSYFSTKYLYVSDTSVTGADSNSGTGTASNSGITYKNSATVLRYVIGV